MRLANLIVLTIQSHLRTDKHMAMYFDIDASFGVNMCMCIDSDISNGVDVGIDVAVNRGSGVDVDVGVAVQCCLR